MPARTRMGGHIRSRRRFNFRATAGQHSRLDSNLLNGSNPGDVGQIQQVLVDKNWMCNNYVYMKTVTTRELLHQNPEIRRRLRQGESIVWQSRGEMIGVIHPPTQEGGTSLRPDWLARARRAGAVMPPSQSLSQVLYDER